MPDDSGSPSGPGPSAAESFWESPETVLRFAAREPDPRLRELAGLYPDPARIRALDLGCAAGRNTLYLAERGFDVIGLDASAAMVAETMRKVAAVFGPGEAGGRVRRGTMDRLEAWGDGTVDLVVALGIYHSAGSRCEWDRSLEETRRVLARGGLVLVADFTDACDPGGAGLVSVPGDPHRFDGMASGRATLMDAASLDREFLRRGLRPLRPTETVSREAEGGRRVTANALYLRV